MGHIGNGFNNFWLFIEENTSLLYTSIAGAEDNGALELLSNTSQAVDEVEDREIIPYATLEKNLWILNGSKITIPCKRLNKDKEDLGYVSDCLCDEICVFEKPPAIDIDFAKKVSILPGLTIVWSVVHGEYPAEFKIGLQLKGFNHNGTKKVIRPNADPVSDCGDSHAPVPFYVTTKGYGIYIDTAHYVSFYCGYGKHKSRKPNPNNTIITTTQELYDKSGLKEKNYDN